MIRRVLALASLAALAACASAQSRYPSLAIRPAERAAGSFEPAPAEPVPAPLPQATLDRVSQLSADARAEHQAFVEAAAAARPRLELARGAGIGEDRLSLAEVALADVRAARSRTMVPLADLDRLYVDAMTRGEAADTIEAARDEVAGLVASEDRTVEELAANLS